MTNDSVARSKVTKLGTFPSSTSWKARAPQCENPSLLPDYRLTVSSTGPRGTVSVSPETKTLNGAAD